jgi:sec-independent protein translocase protein TatA
MGSLSIWHLLIVGVIVLVLFGGKGKLSDIMGDFAKGIKSFKKGLSEDEEKAKAADPKSVEQKSESKE